MFVAKLNRFELTSRVRRVRNVWVLLSSYRTVPKIFPVTALYPVVPLKGRVPSAGKMGATVLDLPVAWIGMALYAQTSVTGDGRIIASPISGFQLIFTPKSFPPHPIRWPP